MKLYSAIAENLRIRVIKEWEKTTGQKEQDSIKANYLTDKSNGLPKKEENKSEWSIRDCILNNDKVKVYMNKSSGFRGSDLNEKLQKYNGYKFYQFVYLGSTGDCPLSYLNTYAIFIGYDDFVDFLNSQKDQFIDDFSAQLEEVDKGKESKKINVSSYKVANHLLGYYIGYFISPKKPTPKHNPNPFLKLTLLICDDDSVYVRTNHLENSNDFKKKFYEGQAIRTNEDTLKLKFTIIDKDNDLYEFSFIFDIQAKRTKEVFEEKYVLKGIYAGEDILTKKPVAGRLIISQKKTWDRLKEENSTRADTIRTFLEKEEYRPEVIEGKNLLDLFFEKTETSNEIREFFTTEERFMEDINSIKQYIRSPSIYNGLAGEYSIYALNSSSTEIKRRVLQISPLGEVTIFRKVKLDNFRKKFHGWATVLTHEVLSIVVNTVIGDKEIEDDENISFLLKLNIKSTENTFKLINGVRIMISSDTTHMPFAGRVVLIKEEEGFYKNEDYIDTIKPFEPKLSENEKIQLDKFRNIHNGGVYSLLLGFDNNLVKTFGPKREKIGYARDIKYKENYYILARYHARLKTNGDYELTVINLFYSFLHGKLELSKLLNKEYPENIHEDFKDFIQDPLYEKAISFEGPDKMIVFDETAIDKIKISLPGLEYS